MSESENIMWPGWETVRLIGRGSFGAVYEIRRQVFDNVEKAALKVISIPQNDSDLEEMYSDGYNEQSITATFQAHLKNIVAEYSLMRKMNGSANIVNCDDVRYVQHDDGIGWDIFIKMELLTPLTKALPENIAENTVIRLGKDLCAALVLCGKHGIVHRDIKPQNIFISPNGDYKLGDFGIAKTVEKTMGGTKVGTYKYMAPEVYNNQPYGSSADIYSLGLVLYWLLNRRRMPFLPLPPASLTAGQDEQARLRRLSGETLPAPADGSDELKRIVLKACAYDPKDRYESAAAMLSDLNKLDVGAGVVAPAVAAATDRQEDDGTVGPVFHGVQEEKTIGPNRDEKKDCPHCGAALAGHEKFCRKCGKTVVAAPIRTEEKKEPDPDATVGPVWGGKLFDSDLTEKEEAKTKDGKKEKKPVLFAVLCVVLAIVTVLALLMLRSCDREESGDKPAKKKNQQSTQQITGQNPTEPEQTEPEPTEPALGRFVVRWGSGDGYDISVSRMSSPKANAAAGMLRNGDVIYEGDVLSVGYTPKTGYSLTQTGKTSVTVTGDVDETDIFAVAEVNSFKASWEKADAYDVSVSRSASPYKNAKTGTLSSGDTVYYGDVLTVTYTAKPGYVLEGTGSAVITVAGNVTDADIHMQTQVNSYRVSWKTEAGYDVTVKRTASPYKNAKTGTLSSGDTVYYGDELSVTYTAKTGYTVGRTGSSTITVTRDVTDADIYATAEIRRFTVSWNNGTGYTVTVKRTKSPYGGASIGELVNSQTIYYGDELSVTYSAKQGYSISSKGKTSITVSGNITASDIYAKVSVNSYTYNVVYKSSNGTALGQTTVTRAHGTTEQVQPKAFSGYETPGSQTVSWDSASAKTITFTYKPKAVAETQALTNGTWWAADYPGTGITYSVNGEYRNRTANSVEVRVVWTQTIKSAWFGFNQYFYCSMWNGGTNRGNTGNVRIASTSTWPASTAHSGSVTASSGWVTVSLNTTNATSVEVACDWWTEGTNCSGSWADKKISIPAY